MKAMFKRFWCRLRHPKVFTPIYHSWRWRCTHPGCGNTGIEYD